MHWSRSGFVPKSSCGLGHPDLFDIWWLLCDVCFCDAGNTTPQEDPKQMERCSSGSQINHFWHKWNSVRQARWINHSWQSLFFCRSGEFGPVSLRGASGKNSFFLSPVPFGLGGALPSNAALHCILMAVGHYACLACQNRNESNLRLPAGLTGHENSFSARDGFVMDGEGGPSHLVSAHLGSPECRMR